MPALVLGIGKPGSMPPPPDDDDMGKSPAQADKEPDSDEGGKATPERALVSHENENCGHCVNYHGEDGSCSEVAGQYDPTDRCYSFFKDAGSSDESEDGQMAPPPDDSAPPQDQ